MPIELDRWNWGAFLLNWIWGLGNNTFIALLMFIPFLNLVMPFVLGAKGSEWAWRNGNWRDGEHFRRVQRNWAIAGLLVWIGFIGLFVGLIAALSTMMRSTAAYQMAMETIAADPRIKASIGDDLKTGVWTNSSINNQANGTGEAKINFPIYGNKGNGTVMVHAVRVFGLWSVRLLVVTIDGAKAPLVLINKDNVPIPP